MTPKQLLKEASLLTFKKHLKHLGFSDSKYLDKMAQAGLDSLSNLWSSLSPTAQSAMKGALLGAVPGGIWEGIKEPEEDESRLVNVLKGMGVGGAIGGGLGALGPGLESLADKTSIEQAAREAEEAASKPNPWIMPAEAGIGAGLGVGSAATLFSKLLGEAPDKAGQLAGLNWGQAMRAGGKWAIPAGVLAALSAAGYQGLTGD